MTILTLEIAFDIIPRWRHMRSMTNLRIRLSTAMSAASGTQFAMIAVSAVRIFCSNRKLMRYTSLVRVLGTGGYKVADFWVVCSIEQN